MAGLVYTGDSRPAAHFPRAPARTDGGTSGGSIMRFVRSPLLCLVGTALVAAVVWTAWAPAQQTPEKKPPAAPVESPEDFAKEMAKFKADKASVMKTQLDLLNARYDLGDKPSKIKMSG